jgi:hypothetical protein
MPFEFPLPHAFSNVSIRAYAPAAPGVYGISNARQWIYIGKTDNIQEQLLQHLAEVGTRIKAHVPTGFTYEVCLWEVRTERHDRLVIEYDPVCNRQTEWRTQKENLMDFVLAGFEEGDGVRKYHFDCVATNRSKRAISVFADVTLARKHEIRVQELPLLCRRLLQSMEPGSLAATITLTEDHMIAVQQVARAAAEKKPHKPPRRPSARAGQQWRNTHR